MIMKNENTQTVTSDLIKRNVVRRFVYDFISHKDRNLREAFPRLFAEWRGSDRWKSPSLPGDNPVHYLCNQLYGYLSSKGENSQLLEQEIERLLASALDVESSDYLEIGERIRTERFDLWGTEDREDDEIAGFMKNNLIGDDPVWLRELSMAARAACCNFPVLISGETGTGKEMVARQIHKYSAQAGQSFVVINCGALPGSLLESELFGYTGGSFTGADREGKIGWIERAAGGTLMLDEISELSPSAQTALLRALQEGELQKVGGEIVNVDFRLISVSNQPLDELVDAGAFRRDLYYRIAVIPIHLPLLRERRDDVESFAVSFLERYIRINTNLSARCISRDAVEDLKSYSWPGNVRELENVIARAMVLCRGKTIEPQHLVYSSASVRGIVNAGKLTERINEFNEPVLSRISIATLVDFLVRKHQKITSSDCALILKISNSTARRYLGILVDKGVLVRKGLKKGTHYMLVNDV